MIEADWNTCTDPQGMLDYLDWKATDRKLWLFAAACCRRVWSLLTDERYRHVVEVAERQADGVASRASVDAAWVAVVDAFTEHYLSGHVEAGHAQGGAAAAMTLGLFSAGAARGVLSAPAEYADFYASDQSHAGAHFTEDRGLWCHLLRDLFGPRPTWPVNTNPICPIPAVLTVAQATYDDRRLPEVTLDPARLTILSDALEQAGCPDLALVEHLRGPGPHWRGCWAVDAVMGRA